MFSYVIYDDVSNPNYATVGSRSIVEMGRVWEEVLVP
jgi:hypothetical protein